MNQPQIQGHPASVDAYIRHGWKLCIIPPSTKGPTTTGWNRPENALKKATDLPPAHGIGLLHCYSATAALDIDDWDNAKVKLAESGIDLDRLYSALDAVGIESGKTGHAKLLYELPFGLRLPTKKITDGSKVLFELRCATTNGLSVQDVLPPSLHPSTNQPYRWVGKGHWSRLPLIPGDLLSLWNSLVQKDQQRSIPSGESLNASWDEIREALDRISPDIDRDRWIAIGMALNWAGLQVSQEAEAFHLWDQWSQGTHENPSHKYQGQNDLLCTWKSFKADGGRTVSTLFGIAKEYGWRRAQKTPEEIFQDVKTDEQSFTRNRLRLISFSELIETQAEVDWLVRDICETSGLGVFFGDPGTFKSFLAINLGLSVATGTDFHGHITKQGPVIYIAGEGQRGIGRRVKGWIQHHGITESDIPFLTATQPVQIINKESAIELQHAIEEIVSVHGKPALVIIDTLARNYGPGDENNTKDMNSFIAHIDEFIRIPYEATVLIIHHTGHTEKNRARGAMALLAALDFEFKVSRIPNNPRMIQVKCTKQKEAEELLDFILEGRDVFVDMKETTLVFESVESDDVKRVPNITGKRQKAFMKSLNELSAEGSVTANALKQKLMTDRILTSANPHKDFTEVKDALIRKKAIKIDGENIESCLPGFYRND